MEHEPQKLCQTIVYFRHILKINRNSPGQKIGKSDFKGQRAVLAAIDTTGIGRILSIEKFGSLDNREEEGARKYW